MEANGRARKWGVQLLYHAEMDDEAARITLVFNPSICASLPKSTKGWELRAKQYGWTKRGIQRRR